MFFFLEKVLIENVLESSDEETLGESSKKTKKQSNLDELNELIQEEIKKRMNQNYDTLKKLN